MESGAEFLAPQDTATVRVIEEIQAAKKQRNHWWTEATCPRLKEALVNSQYPSLSVKCDEACLSLGFDQVPKQTVFNVLRRIDRKPTTYDNAFLKKSRALLSGNQLNYVEYIIVKRDTENLGVSRK